MPYSDYMQIIIRAGYDTAVKTVEVSKGWFEENRETLQPLCKQRDALAHAHRAERDPVEKVKKKRLLEIAKVFLKGKVKDAKASWSRNMAEKVHGMNIAPKKAWKAAYELMAGLLGHSKKHITMSLRMEDGRRATNGKENLSVAIFHTFTNSSTCRGLVGPQQLRSSPNVSSLTLSTMISLSLSLRRPR